MATSKHDTGWYNVRGTLAAWITAQINAYAPPLVSAISIVYDWPEAELVLPCWSVTFLGVVPTAFRYQGSYVGNGEYGERKAGLMEVNCWVTRHSNVGFAAQLAQMADAVYRGVFAVMKTGSGLVIKDFYTSASAPADTSNRVIIEGAEDRNPPTDPNPDIERRRIIISFNWVERA